MWAVLRYTLTSKGQIDHRRLRTLAAFADQYWADRFAVEMAGDVGPGVHIALVRSRRWNGARLPKFYGRVDDRGRVWWDEWTVATPHD